MSVLKQTFLSSVEKKKTFRIFFFVVVVHMHKQTLLIFICIYYLLFKQVLEKHSEPFFKHKLVICRGSCVVYSAALIIIKLETWKLQVSIARICVPSLSVFFFILNMYTYFLLRLQIRCKLLQTWHCICECKLHYSGQ